MYKYLYISKYIYIYVYKYNMNKSPSTSFPLKPISSGHCLFGNVWFFGASPMKIYCEPSLPCKQLYGRRGSSRRNPGNVSKPDKSNSVWMLFAMACEKTHPKNGENTNSNVILGSLTKDIMDILIGIGLFDSCVK